MVYRNTSNGQNFSSSLQFTKNLYSAGRSTGTINSYFRVDIRTKIRCAIFIYFQINQCVPTTATKVN
mgnify:CR=1 FL=1